MKKQRMNAYTLAFTGVMAAIVYVVTLFRFPLLGSKVHFANAMCLLSGMLFGGVGLILTIVMYVISGGFAGMEITQMVWKAAGCLAWQVGITLALTRLINFLAFFFFDAKGNPRRKKKKEE